MKKIQGEAKEPEPVLSDAKEAKECKNCKLILLFAFFGLLLVMIIVYVEIANTKVVRPVVAGSIPIHSIPATIEDAASTTLEFNQRVLELGQTAFGTGGDREVGGTSASSSITLPAQLPDGPSPVMPPQLP